MGLPQKSFKRDFFTYADYLTWPASERWELIDGEAFAMTPAPGRTHQELSIALSSKIYAFFEDHECQAFAAPFDVRLPEADESEEFASNVVQPDIVVYCDQNKLDERGGKGAPDLAVEIMSPTSANRDLIDKMALYERHGVREYWIVDPVHQIIFVRHLESDGHFSREIIFGRKDELKSVIFPQLHIDLQKVFPNIERKVTPSPSSKDSKDKRSKKTAK